MPNFRISRFRPIIFLGKYLLIPSIGFSIGKYDIFVLRKYFMNE
jgi:hypothetical protein